jgi:hypothetical protein
MSLGYYYAHKEQIAEHRKEFYQANKNAITAKAKRKYKLIKEKKL